MKTVFVITKVITGPAGHGEPGTPYLTLRTNGEWFTLGTPDPAFTTRDKAQKWLDENDKYKFFNITKLTVKE